MGGPPYRGPPPPPRGRAIPRAQGTQGTDIHPVPPHPTLQAAQATSLATQLNLNKQRDSLKKLLLDIFKHQQDSSASPSGSLPTNIIQLVKNIEIMLFNKANNRDYREKAKIVIERLKVVDV